MRIDFVYRPILVRFKDAEAPFSLGDRFSFPESLEDPIRQKEARPRAGAQRASRTKDDGCH